MHEKLRYAAFLASFVFCAEPVASIADTVTLTPRVIPVGKWAEGMAISEGNLWVAESGQRSIVELDPKTGAVLRRVNVGRMPVGMTSSVDATVNVLVQTDKLIWREPPSKGMSSKVAGLEGCPDGIASGDRYLWVLTEPDCSSETSRLVRIDPRKGSRAATEDLGQWGQALLAQPGDIWVAHARSPALTVVDATTLSSRAVDLTDASLWAIAGRLDHVYVGGRLLSNTARGIVSMLDPTTFDEQRRQSVDQMAAFITCDARNVVAVGEKGEIWVFSADKLDLQRTITLSSGAFQPRSVLIDGDSLYVTSLKQDGENGAVIVLDDWRPAPAQ
jgi:streptogramin lyase